MTDHLLTVVQQLALKSAAARLAVDFEGVFGPVTIERFLASSYDQFASRATATNFLPVMAERRGRLSTRHRTQVLQVLADLPIEIDEETSGRAWRETLVLAEAHRLTLYDAAYLELAVRRSLPLATRDAALRSAAEAAGVPLLAG